MATAKKLPSGSWRCQVFSHYEIVLDKNGKPVIDPKTKKQKQKRIYKSFTCDDPSARGKRKAEAMAAEWADNKEIKKDEEVQMTFDDALEKYIQEAINSIICKSIENSISNNYSKCFKFIRFILV